MQRRCLIGTLDNYVVFFDEFGLASDHECFTLPGKIRLCASPHRRLSLLRVSDRAAAGGRHFRGRRGRCLADTDLTMVERLGAARNAGS